MFVLGVRFLIGEDVGVGAATTLVREAIAALVREAIGEGFWLPETQPQLPLGAVFMYHIVCRMVNVCLALVCRINVRVFFCFQVLGELEERLKHFRLNSQQHFLKVSLKRTT